MLEQFGALLAPVAAPAGAGAAEAVETHENVEGVGGGHDALLEFASSVREGRPATTPELIVVLIS
jgi:hypothetical protein